MAVSADCFVCAISSDHAGELMDVVGVGLGTFAIVFGIIIIFVGYGAALDRRNLLVAILLVTSMIIWGMTCIGAGMLIIDTALTKTIDTCQTEMEDE